MEFKPTPLEGAWVISLDPLGDHRGRFTRTFCLKEFEEHGIEFNVAQCNTSFNEEAGTLRGMHFQTDPAAESKLVRCIRGALYDVIVDLRPESPTYMKHFGIQLTGEDFKMLYVPRNFAHGFMTLKGNTEIFYMMDEFYAPEYASGVRCNDPSLAIEWPMSPKVVSEKDLGWPLL